MSGMTDLDPALRANLNHKLDQVVQGGYVRYLDGLEVVMDGDFTLEDLENIVAVLKEIKGGGREMDHARMIERKE